MRPCRRLTTVALLACAVAPSAVAPSARAEAPAAQVTPSRGLLPAADVARRDRAARVRRAAIARRIELRRLRGTRTVRGALRRAWLSGHLSAAEHARLRRIWWTTTRAHGRLAGRRRAELGAPIAVAASLARRRLLTTTRLNAVFLTLQRNRDFWLREPIPRPKQRFTAGRDPVVLQYYAGQGLAIQPLATFGRANALARACLEGAETARAAARTGRARRYPCRPRALARVLDRMVELGARRGGFLAWEHLFAFGGGAAPWISGMTQATGAQALARGRRALDVPRYGRAARQALGAFEAATPLGVSVPAPGGRRYTMYSFDPHLRILNGELQSVIGLRDAATLLGSRRARRLYRRAEGAARRAIAAFDTGAWSLYSRDGAESTLEYHRLVGDFLGGMCERTGRRAYCATERRFARYVREPPRVGVRPLRGVRPRRATAITFTLSKVSDVQVSVRTRRGVELRRTLRLPRGRHRVRWTPRRKGAHRVSIAATGPAGTRAVVRRTVAVRRPARAPRARARTRGTAGRDRSPDRARR